jgi:hypothetical protein
MKKYLFGFFLAIICLLATLGVEYILLSEILISREEYMLLERIILGLFKFSIILIFSLAQVVLAVFGFISIDVYREKYDKSH